MFPLRPGEICLLTGSLDPHPRVLEMLEGLLSEEERVRVDRLQLPHVRRRTLATRGWVRLLLGLVTGSDPLGLVFRTGLRGKPYLQEGPSFNLAHTGDHVLLALATEGEVGVDAEEARPLPDLEALARRIFTPDERAELFALPPGPERASAFLRGWTRKEALLKAMGEGLFRSPRGFAVDLHGSSGQLLRWMDPTREESRNASGPPAGARISASRSWFLVDAREAAPPGGAAAVAWDQQPRGIRVTRLPSDPDAVAAFVRAGSGTG